MTKANDLRVDLFSSNVSFLCLIFLFLKLNSRNTQKRGREGGKSRSKYRPLSSNISNLALSGFMV